MTIDQLIFVRNTVAWANDVLTSTERQKNLPRLFLQMEESLKLLNNEVETEQPPA